MILNDFDGTQNNKEYFSSIFQKNKCDRILAKNALFNDSQNFKVLKKGTLKHKLLKNPNYQNKCLKYSDNDYVKNKIDVHDQTVTMLAMLNKEAR